MALLVLLAMLTVCAAVPQDLNDKMFTFPQQTKTAHVRLTASKKKMEAVSVCLRFFTDLPRSYSFFSLATPSEHNNFLIWKEGADDLFRIYVMGKFAEFRGLNHKPNTWHSLCATWNSTTGVGQLWLDGNPSSRKFITSGSSIRAPFIIELGQEQDSYGGKFDIKQSFVGMMTDVHMWDYILPRQEIENYNAIYVYSPPGNVLNWKGLHFQTFGRVLLEDVQV